MKTSTITMVRMALAAALLLMCAQVSLADEDLTPAFQSGGANGVDFIAGGIGLDERESLERIAGNKYNVKLVFALSNRDFVSDVTVEITNAKGKKILDIISSGPICYVKLPAGSYTVRTSYEGVAKTQHINAGSAASRQVVFAWR
ncbi:MAG: hypothetical protein L7F77_06175 [Candidatus Magnetominusculus sp. LBB02]|nr:hypothetical protein [Candidatus Magnetominusculus sp. LBB02]